MVMAVLFVWAVESVTWGVYRVLTGGTAALLHADVTGLLIWLAASTVITWMTAGAAAAVLGYKRRFERRLA